MAGLVKEYLLEEDITLYAYRVDDSALDVAITASSTIWMNREITAKATAEDFLHKNMDENMS